MAQYYRKMVPSVSKYQMYSEGGIGLYGEHEKVTMFPTGVDRDVTHDLSSILFSVIFAPFLKFLIGN